MKSYDVIIVGAGLVGLSMALALRHTGLRVAILEKNLLQTVSRAESQDRPISLTRGSELILKALSVWSDLKAQASPIMAVDVSEQGVFGSLLFEAKALGVDALGAVLPYNILYQALYEAVSAQADVDIISITALETVSFSEDGDIVP